MKSQKFLKFKINYDSKGKLKFHQNNKKLLVNTISSGLKQNTMRLAYHFLIIQQMPAFTDDIYIELSSNYRSLDVSWQLEIGGDYVFDARD